MEKFEAEVAVMTDFMGSVVLNAVSEGKPIVTPNTPKGDENGEGGFGQFIFEGQTDNNESDTATEKIITQIVHTAADAGDEDDP